MPTIVPDIEQKEDILLPFVIYFRSEKAEMTSGVLQQLEKDAMCKIEICNSWSSLLIQLNILSSLSITSPIILVDVSMFEQKDATVSEMANMISTMHRCLKIPMRMSLGVVTEKLCSIETIKVLQETDVLGVIPCIKLLGYEKTLFALSEILVGKSYWPKEVLEAVTGITIIKVPKIAGIVLTSRQQQVLTLVCNRGLSNKKIAQALKISESTVKIHMSAILKEYGVRNRTQLVLAANSSLKA